MGTFMCIFEPIDDCTALSIQYLTSIFSEYSCTNPYYWWHELQSDSTFPCDNLRIISRHSTKIPVTALSNLCQSSNACNSTYRNDSKKLLQNYPSLTLLLNNQTKFYFW